MEAYELKGRWWRPDNPEDDVAGTLRFSDHDGIRLELEGVFASDAEWQPLDDAGDRIILNGISETGHRVTLIDAQHIGTARSFPGYDRSSFMARYVLRGACIERREELVFDCYRLRYAGAAEWWSRTGLQPEDRPKRDQAGHRIIRHIYIEQDPLSVRLADAELSVHVAEKWQRSRRHAEIDEAVLLNVKPNEPCTLDQWRACYGNPLSELMTLGMGRVALLESIEVENPTAVIDLNGRSYRTPLEVDHPQHRAAELSAVWSPQEVLFSLDDIAEHLGEVVQRWLDVRKRYTLARQLYFSTRFAPYMYKQTELIYLVQACESFHVLRHGKRGRPSAADHAQALEEVMSAIPPRHRGWVEPRLAGRPAISLQNRLAYLCQEHSEIVAPLVASVKAFCRRVATTRHFLTHGTKQSDDVITDMREVLHAAWVLRILFEACLLRELGITPSIVATCSSLSVRCSE